MRTIGAVVLLVFLTQAAAQVSTPAERDPTTRGAGAVRIPQGGAGMVMDHRIQGTGISVPKGLEEQQMGELPKPEPTLQSAPKPSAPQAPPAPPK